MKLSKSPGLSLQLFICTLLFTLPAAYGQTAQQEAQTTVPQIVRKSGGVLAASATNRVEPAYPPLAKAARISGAVVVEVTLDEEGNVVAARALSGHPLLKDAAVSAAREWRFTPTKLSGEAVKVVGTITFNFSLPAKPEEDGEELKQAKEAVQAKPDSPEARLRLGEAYIDSERYEEAIAAFQEAIRLKPDYEPAYFQLAETYYDFMKQPEEAIATYRRALKALPSSALLFDRLGITLGPRKGRHSEAIEVYKQWLQSDPNNQLAYHRLAWNSMMAKRYQEAIDAAHQAIRLGAKDVGLYHSLGFCYYNIQKYDEAISVYLQVPDLNPRYTLMDKVYAETGFCFYMTKRYAEALQAFNKSINLNADCPEVYCTAGKCYNALGRIEEAIAIIKKGIAMVPDDGCMHDTLAALYKQTGQAQQLDKTLEASETLLRQQLEQDPKSVNLRMRLAWSLAQRRQFAQAEAEYQAILQIEPDNAMALNNLGYGLLERNANLEEAVQMIQRAVTIEPNNDAYLDSLGWAYFKLGKLAEAEKYLTRAASLNKTSAELREHLGDLYYKQGRIELAKEVWQKALSMAAEGEEKERLRVKLKRQAQ
jgi:TonB family protein